MRTKFPLIEFLEKPVSEEEIGTATVLQKFVRGMILKDVAAMKPLFSKGAIVKSRFVGGMTSTNKKDYLKSLQKVAGYISDYKLYNVRIEVNGPSLVNVYCTARWRSVKNWLPHTAQLYFNIVKQPNGWFIKEISSLE